ncbi:YheU family protein [Desulfosarcina sp.]|uniref:YheU family protein n=1 Tax=Desulfosarcina sp. TaxID=2027861 RepID=UPI003561757E
MPDREAMLVIPHRQLSPEALAGLIEEFVTRDGTDSGYTQGSLVENVAMVRRQLDNGQAVVAFDNLTQTCNIVSVETLRENAEEPKFKSS